MTLNDVIAEIRGLQEVVGVLAKSPPVLYPREYGICQMGHTQDVVEIDGVEKVKTVPHALGDPCPPGKSCTYVFGVEFKDVTSGVPGLPETFMKGLGVERPFLAEAFEVDDECAEYFDIESVFFGAKGWFCTWSERGLVPATRFVKTASVVKIRESMPEGAQITVAVRNKSKEPRVFKAKFIGQEARPIEVQFEAIK